MQHINRARGRARKAAGSNPSDLPNIELEVRGDEVDLSKIEPEPIGIFISEVGALMTPPELDRDRFLPLHQAMSKPASFTVTLTL